MPSHTAKAKGLAKTLNAPKLEVKEAVAIAEASFRDLFPATAKANMMLEELEESGDGKQWLVTIGFDTTARPRTLLDVGGTVRALQDLCDR